MMAVTAATDTTTVSANRNSSLRRKLTESPQRARRYLTASFHQEAVLVHERSSEKRLRFANTRSGSHDESGVKRFLQNRGCSRMSWQMLAQEVGRRALAHRGRSRNQPKAAP